MSTRPRAGLASVVLFFFATVVVAAQPESGAYVQVVDVGAGLCCAARLPGNHYMIYDAGRSKNDLKAIEEVIPEGATVNLMVLSHSDADHLAAVPGICEHYALKRVIRDGFPRDTKTWQAADRAIRDKAASEGCQDLNLSHVSLAPGAKFPLGETSVTFVCGFGDLPKDWPPLNRAEQINARSVVVRLDYAGTSVLFTGDTVGKHDGGEDKCIAAEQFMVSNAGHVPIHSQILVAPHHGGDNASSTEWIRAVAPEYVIFSAGHKYEHPRQVTAERYLAAGIALSHIFRTDLGDNEGGEEWDHGSSEEGHEAGTGNVGVWIKPDGHYTVSYLADKNIAGGGVAEVASLPAASRIAVTPSPPTPPRAPPMAAKPSPAPEPSLSLSSTANQPPSTTASQPALRVPPCVCCSQRHVPFWGWILGLLPSLVVLNQALYVVLVRAQQIKKGLRGSSPSNTAEIKRLLKPREAIRSETQDYFGILSLSVRLGIPTLLLGLVGILLVQVVFRLPSSLAWIGLPTIGGVVAGAIGAYVYCMFQLGQRNFQHDISSGLAVWSAVQLAVGPILGGAVLYVWRGSGPDPSLSVLAVPFLAGFAPRLLMDAAQNMARRLWGGGNVQTPRSLPLMTIRGIDDRIQERLSEEGIFDVYSLAMANPLRLLRNTPFDKRQVIAWIDEALLMAFLPKCWETLEEHSITGAIDLAWEWSQSPKNAPSRELNELAAACHLPVALLADAARRLYEDAQVGVIWALYNGDEGGDEEERGAYAAAQPGVAPETNTGNEPEAAPSTRAEE